MKPIKFHIKQDLESGGYFAESHISDNEQIITQGDSLFELENNIKDAINCHFENQEDLEMKLVR